MTKTGTETTHMTVWVTSIKVNTMVQKIRNYIGKLRRKKVKETILL